MKGKSNQFQHFGDFDRVHATLISALPSFRTIPITDIIDPSSMGCAEPAN